MLRSLLTTGKQVYTCTCVTKSNLPSLQCFPILSTLSNNFQTSAVNEVLSKRVREKKAIQKTTQKLQIEVIPEGDDEELILEGLSESAGTVTPTLETHNLLIGGIKFTELPIAHIRSTKNNTIITVSDHKGKSIVVSSSGNEGFKNAKKGTNIAAQATGISVGTKAADHGLKYIRVVVKGLGIGRWPAIKGLQMSGLHIVSLTDNTMIPHFGKRPRSQRSV